MMCDVIVIGAGPVGSRVAGRLAELNRRVLVLERNPGPGGKVSCAGIIGKECAEAFGISPDVILRTVNSAKLFSPSGHILHVHRNEPQAVILDRVAFDIRMAERAQAAGAEFRFNSRVTGVKVRKDRAEAVFTSGDSELAISAGAVVIATGFSPGLIRKLGLGRYHDSTTGVQAEVEAPGIEEVEVYFGDVAPKFFGWIVPTTGGQARIGLLSRDHAGEKLKAWLKSLAGEGRITTPETPVHHGRIPLKPLRRTHGVRLLVAGDAAGQVKPTSGGGIYYGLLCADIAADVLNGSITDNDFSAGRLSAYEKQWRRLLGHELRTGYRGRWFYERLSRRSVDRLFTWALKRGIDTALLQAEDLSFDWHSRTITRLIRYRLTSIFRRLFRFPFSRRPD